VTAGGSDDLAPALKALWAEIALALAAAAMLAGHPTSAQHGRNLVEAIYAVLVEAGAWDEDTMAPLFLLAAKQIPEAAAPAQATVAEWQSYMAVAAAAAQYVRAKSGDDAGKEAWSKVVTDAPPPWVLPVNFGPLFTQTLH
jgi:hypothetical protein